MRIIRIVVWLFFLLSSVYGHLISMPALQMANRRLQKNANDVEALLIRAHYYSNQKMYAKAITDLERVRSLLTTKNAQSIPGIYLNLAALYLKLDKLDKALAWYNVILTDKFCRRYKNRLVYQAIWERMTVYQRKQNYLRAWQDLQRISQVMPETLTVLAKAAQIAERAGQHERALQWYHRKLIKFPGATTETGLHHILKLFLACKKISAAEKLLTELIAKLPQDPLPYFYRAILYKKYLNNAPQFHQDLQQALAIAQRLLSAENNALEGLLWKARISLLLRQPQPALQYINRAIAIDAKHPTLYDLRSRIYKALNRPRQQTMDVAKYRQLLQKIPNDWLQISYFED